MAPESIERSLEAHKLMIVGFLVARKTQKDVRDELAGKGVVITQVALDISA